MPNEPVLSTLDHEAGLEAASHDHTVEIDGHSLVALDTDKTADRLFAEVQSPVASTPLLAVHVNAHALRVLGARPVLFATLERRALLLFEGIGLKLACLITKRLWLPDTNGSDVSHALFERLRGTGARVFLLGGRVEIAEAAARRLTDRHGVAVVGWRDGYFADSDLGGVRAAIEAARPTILLVGLGCPRQEGVALQLLDVPGLRLVWTVGGLFDFLARAVPRAPALVRRLRLEWLFRILVEPRRLAPRYVRDAAFLVRALWRGTFART